MKSILGYLVPVLCLTSTETVKFRCDYRYTSEGWFKYHEVPMTWHDARLQCQLEGAILASPTTPEIRSIMVESTSNNKIFTGIHATLNSGQFHSIRGTPLAQIPHEWDTYHYEDRNNAEDCIAMLSNGLFTDEKCDHHLPFVCYRKNIQTKVNFCGTPDPEYRFESVTNKCYKFHTNPRTFKRANFACTAEGGHLAIINSEDEAAVIRRIFGEYPDYTMIGYFWKDVAFVGFYNWGESADWTTIHGQTLKDAGYDKFSAGEPDNSTTGEYCGSVYRDASLNDLWCEGHFAFICEKRPDYPPLCDSVDHDD